MLAVLLLPVYVFTPFFILLLLLYFLFIRWSYTNKLFIFGFVAFVCHFKNTISILVTIFSFSHSDIGKSWLKCCNDQLCMYVCQGYRSVKEEESIFYFLGHWPSLARPFLVNLTELSSIDIKDMASFIKLSSWFYSAE